MLDTCPEKLIVNNEISLIRCFEKLTKNEREINF